MGEIILVLLFLFVLVPLAIAGKSMAPWVPTRSHDIQRVQDLLKLDPWENFLEIGTGDGRIAAAVAKEFPDSKIVGIELAPAMFCVAWIRKFLQGTDNFSVVLWDAFSRDFSHFDAIYVYGMPDKMQKKIVPKFMQEAKAGAKLYSYVFSIPEEYKKYTQSHWEKDQAKIHILKK